MDREVLMHDEKNQIWETKAELGYQKQEAQMLMVDFGCFFFFFTMLTIREQLLMLL